MPEEDLAGGQVQPVTGSPCHVVETTVGLAAVFFKRQGEVIKNALERAPGSIAREQGREENPPGHEQQTSLSHSNFHT